MKNYIDGFLFPIHRDHLIEYKSAAEKIADVWKEHGALAYCEYIGDDMKLEGTLPFADVLPLSDDEVLIFGWVLFDSRKSRDVANTKVAADPRMADLAKPLFDSTKMIFDASKMAYGGFQSFINK